MVMCSTETRGETSAIPEFRTRAQQREKAPPCQLQCPNSGDVRGWIGVIAQHEKNNLTLDEAYDRAWMMIAERNPLPATISRICPHPCEDQCSRRDKDGAVSINALERFLGDWGLSRALKLPPAEPEVRSESVGVVGSGPAGLSFAYQMARRGYDVCIYEQQDAPGGMLRHAIPDYRLPREILDAEIGRLLGLGITLLSDTNVGAASDFDELRERHSLVFLGVGAQAARSLGIPGERATGVVSGIDYLRHRKEQPGSLSGLNVVVIGGGNTAIDAARCAVRDGASATVIYRRSEAEMPAAVHEVDDAKTEGVEFRFLLAPTRIESENDLVEYVEVQQMRLGEPDEQGRRRPLPVPGAVEEIAADRVIVAVAQEPDWHGMEDVAAVVGESAAGTAGKLGDRLWTGGDNCGAGIAGAAIAQGRLAAEAAHAEICGRPVQEWVRPESVIPGSVRSDYYNARAPLHRPRRHEDEWLADPEAEINRTIGYEQAFEEAKRCMSCGLCFDCQQCFMYCNGAGFTRLEETGPGRYFALALDACEGCGKCIEICPCGYLEAREE